MIILKTILLVVLAPIWIPLVVLRLLFELIKALCESICRFYKKYKSSVFDCFVGLWKATKSFFMRFFQGLGYSLEALWFIFSNYCFFDLLLGIRSTWLALLEIVVKSAVVKWRALVGLKIIAFHFLKILGVGMLYTMIPVWDFVVMNLKGLFYSFKTLIDWFCFVGRYVLKGVVFSCGGVWFLLYTWLRSNFKGLKWSFLTVFGWGLDLMIFVKIGFFYSLETLYGDLVVRNLVVYRYSGVFLWRYVLIPNFRLFGYVCKTATKWLNMNIRGLGYSFKALCGYLNTTRSSLYVVFWVLVVILFNVIRVRKTPFSRLRRDQGCQRALK